MPRFDIRRAKKEVDTTLGGVSMTSTAIETKFIDLQHLRGSEILGLGGLRIEAQYKGFCHEDTDIREHDVITPDSGSTRYEITFVEGLYNEHIQFFAKKVD